MINHIDTKVQISAIAIYQGWMKSSDSVPCRLRYKEFASTQHNINTAQTAYGLII